jgi:uncharacterized protein YhfF
MAHDEILADAAHAALPGRPPAVTFGVTAEQQDELARLIASGRKRATTSVLAAYRAEGEPLPEPGDLAVVADGSGRPVCTIRTIDVEIRRYGDVDARHAAEEGEGDGTLEGWRSAHQPFLTAICAALAIPLDDDLELVLERFRVVAPPCAHPRSV